MKRRTLALPPGRKASPFVLLDLEHQKTSVERLSDSGIQDHAIAELTGLDVTAVRRILAERGIRAKEAGR